MSSDPYLHIDAGRVIFDTTRMLEAFPEMAEDETLRADTLEGSTDLPSVMRRLLRASQDAEALAKGARAAAQETEGRARRFEARDKKLRSLMLAIMEAGDLPKLELPFATFTVRGPQPGVVVDDVDELPQGFRRVKVEAAKAEIKKALMAGEDVPGARLEFGEASIQIRGA